jgi:hypothetical protein
MEGLSQAHESLRLALEVYPPDHLLLFEPKLVRGRALLALSRLEEAVKEIESAYAMVLLAYGAENGDCRDAASVRVELAEKMGDAAAVELWKGRAK